jgi:hypothetical protein
VGNSGIIPMTEAIVEGMDQRFQCPLFNLPGYRKKGDNSSLGDVSPNNPGRAEMSPNQESIFYFTV